MLKVKKTNIWMITRLKVKKNKILHQEMKQKQNQLFPNILENPFQLIKSFFALQNRFTKTNKSQI